MTCPNCGAVAGDNAHFCQNCGFRFDEIPRVEPIRIDISPDAATPPNPNARIAPPIVVREKKSGATIAVVALTVLLTLLVIGVGGLLAFYFLTRSNERDDIAGANRINTNLPAPVAASPSPQPTTYEDLMNKLAPPDKRTSLLDESFEVTEARAAEFSITNPKGARIVGGFRVTKGKDIDFSIEPGGANGDSSGEDLKPLLEEKNTRSKIVNFKLKPGDYQLFFANEDAAPVGVAAEFFVVED